MSTLDPITAGPLRSRTFKKLTDAPFGKATEIIRQYDPILGSWGRRGKSDGKSNVRQRSRGVAYVEAISQKEADALADDLTMDDIEWDDDFDILSVKPHVDPPKKETKRAG